MTKTAPTPSSEASQSNTKGYSKSENELTCNDLECYLEYFGDRLYFVVVVVVAAVVAHGNLTANVFVAVSFFFCECFYFL